MLRSSARAMNTIMASSLRAPLTHPDYCQRLALAFPTGSPCLRLLFPFSWFLVAIAYFLVAPYPVTFLFHRPHGSRSYAPAHNLFHHILSFTRRSVICALRSGARVHTHWLARFRPCRRKLCYQYASCGRWGWVLRVCRCV